MPVFTKLIGRSPKGILFDLDGTLVDSVPDLAVAVDAMLAGADLPLAGEDNVRSWVGNGARKLVERALAFATFRPESELDKTELDSHHQQFLRFYRDSSAQYSKLYEGVLPALNYWQEQGIKMALVTNKPSEFIGPLLKRFQIDQFFSVLVGGDSLPESKPAPEPLLYASQELGLAVDDCIMLGDSRHDVDAARAANMSVVCVSYGYNHGEPIQVSSPDAIVDRLDELCLVVG